MCGIYGQFNFRGDRPVVESDVRDATRTIAHRGPDDEGFYVRGPLGLGFRRLSIIDLSGGHQPMTDAEESVWIIFNGEIYNFQELRTELEAEGCVFRTRSDTEVIIHGYKTWGDVKMSVVGEKGVIELDMFSQAFDYYPKDGKHGLAGFGSDLDALLITSFVDALTSGKPAVTAEDGIMAARAAIRGYESARSGQPVAF